MRYVLFPSYVASRFDDDFHFINAHQLLDLYDIDDHVRVSDCLVIKHHKPLKVYQPMNGDVLLKVDPSGRYKIPEPYENKHEY